MRRTVSLVRAPRYATLLSATLILIYPRERSFCPTEFLQQKNLGGILSSKWILSFDYRIYECWNILDISVPRI